MAGPSKENRRLKAKNDRRKAAASRGGRTRSEAALGKSMAARGRPVSRTNQRVPRPAATRSAPTLRASKNPLASPAIVEAVSRLRKRYSPPTGSTSKDLPMPSMDQFRTAKAEKGLEDTALQSFGVAEPPKNKPLTGGGAKARRAIGRFRAGTQLDRKGKTVKRFAGRRVEGRIPVEDVEQAAREGTLRPERGNRVSTPEVRQVKRRAKRVQKKIARVERKATVGGMPSGVPKEYAKWIRKYSPRIDKQARETYGLSGNEFMAKMLKGESGFNMDTVGPNTPYGNARGAAQFIPGTRKAFVDKFGIDPWRSKKEAVQAMALHLDGKSYSKTFGIQGYNPGINDSYYLNQDVGETQKANPKARQRLKELRGRAKAIDEQAAGLGIRGTQKPKARVAEPKQAKGDYAGSKRIIQKILGAPVTGDKYQEESSRDGQHWLPNAYAQDIQLGSANPAENEPVYDQALLDKITRRIRKMGGQVPDLKIGMGQVKGSLRGYELQIIPDSETRKHGTGAHLHIGATWTGKNLPPGTQLGGSDSGGGGNTGGGGTTVTSIGPSGTQTFQYEGEKKSLREILLDVGFDVSPKGIRRVGERGQSREARKESLGSMKRRYGIK